MTRTSGQSLDNRRNSCETQLGGKTSEMGVADNVEFNVCVCWRVCGGREVPVQCLRVRVCVCVSEWR